MKLLFRAGFWLALLVAYVFALLPSDPHVFQYDKANHGLAFVVLAGLARLGYPAKGAVVILAALVGFGILIELSQALPIIHRDASVGDVVADTLAAIAGVLLGSVMLTILRGRRLL